jgi:hypothetical protein
MKLRPFVFAVALLGAASSAVADGAALKPIDGPTDAAAGVLGAPPPGKGQVVFYVPKIYGNNGGAFSIRENGRGVVKLSYGTYGIAVVEPGRHVFEIKTEASDAITLEIDEGETYYVEETFSMGVLLMRPQLRPANEGNFQASSTKLKPTKLKPTDAGQKGGK